MVCKGGCELAFEEGQKVRDLVQSGHDGRRKQLAHRCRGAEYTGCWGPGLMEELTARDETRKVRDANPKPFSPDISLPSLSGRKN